MSAAGVQSESKEERRSDTGKNEVSHDVTSLLPPNNLEDQNQSATMPHSMPTKQNNESSELPPKADHAEHTERYSPKDGEFAAEIQGWKKVAQTRLERSEGSWEDITSDEESDLNRTQNTKSLSPMSEVVDGFKKSSITTDDQWEDEDSSDSDVGSTDSSATEGPSTEYERRSDQQTIRSTSNGNSTGKKLSRMSSSQRAMHDYKKSKLALMSTQNDNVSRYKQLMGIGGDPTAISIPGGREMKRTDTADRLENIEPFTAAHTTEAVDDAEGANRAQEISFSGGQPWASPSIATESTVPKDITMLSPGFASDRQASSPAHSPALLASARLYQHKPDTAESVVERFASEQSTPTVENPPNQSWRMVQPDATENSQISGHLQSNISPPNCTNNQGLGLDTGVAKAPSKEEEKLNMSRKPSHVEHSSISRARPETIMTHLDQLSDAAPPFSLWDYLKEEILATDFDSTQEMKWERVTNFIAIPFHMEKTMLFGFFVCLDSFLYTFTILPLRFGVALYLWIRNSLVWLAGGQKRYLHSSHKCDLLKGCLIVSSCYVLSRVTDASKMYHSVRGQDVIKLYVIFNVLEIADRLCCSFGQDLLDSLFSRNTLARRKDGRQPYLRPIGFFSLSLLYVFAHTLVLLYQLVTLNVAINSYDNALLTLLISNQFVEIKGSVFKKFEKENLFQLTCADIVERFQLTLMLFAIGMRNLVEMSGAAGNSVAAASSSTLPEQHGISSSNQSGNTNSIASSSLSALALLGPLPTSFTVFPSFTLLETILTPVCIVMASECLVDWLKHAFITKFNHIRPSVYDRFMDVLCRDLIIAGPSMRSASSNRRHSFVDQSPIVSRRLGFAAVPLVCLLVRMTSQIMGMLEDDSHFDECASPSFSSSHSPVEDNSTIITVWHILRRPLIAIAQPMIPNAAAQLDVILMYVWSIAAWILTVTIAWVS